MLTFAEFAPLCVILLSPIEQATQIQKVSAQVEMSRTAPQVADNH
jgi:hypothetical protein